MQPTSLTDQGRRAVNVQLSHRCDIEQLCIPLCLKKLLYKNYLSDKLWCTETMDPCDECIREVNRRSFEHFWESVSADEFLTLMNWKYGDGVPDFAYADNVIVKRYYQNYPRNGGWDPDQRLCKPCLSRNRDKYVYSCTVSYDRLSGSEIMDEIFQCMENWCSECKTATLFKIIDKEEWGCGVPSCSTKRYRQFDNSE